MGNDKCGIYQILCVSGKSYVGSSGRIYRRWSEHRNLLRRSAHPSPRLQQAWNKHGEGNFVFSVLEECSKAELFKREQHWIDLKKRDYNSMPKVRVITPEMRAKMNAKMALIASQRTHCPHGHEFTESNTYISKTDGARICRTCARERTRAVLAKETPEQKAKRIAKQLEYQQKNREKRLTKQREYAVRTKEQKKLYDIAYRPIKNARRREMSLRNG